MDIESKNCVRNLGAWFDSMLSMETHVNKVCSSGFYYLGGGGGGGVHNLRRIRRCLSQDCLVTLIHTFVTSRLDYSNSLMYGLLQCQISKLRSVQNTAACIALDLSNFSHITPALRQLHWLPVAKGIQFKILLLTFKAIHGLCQTQIYGQYSAATYSTLLLRPMQKMLPTLGACSFATAAAPALWNKLPADVRNVASLNSFKKSIKTFLFNKSL